MIRKCLNSGQISLKVYLYLSMHGYCLTTNLKRLDSEYCSPKSHYLFIPNKLNTKLYQQFGSLSVYDVATEEKGYASYETSETGSPLKPLLDDKV